jgi:CBS domain containing-hemolysin-like protein
MELNLSTRLLLMLLILGINSFFAAAETALISVRRSRLNQLAQEGRFGASAALALLQNPERLLSVVQVGVTLASLGLGWLGEETLYQVFDGVIGRPDTAAEVAASHIISLVLAFTLMTFFHVVVGEVVPKNLALEKSDRLSLLAAPILLVFYRVTEPFVWVIERASGVVSRLIGLRGEATGGGHSAEELRFILRGSLQEGQLAQYEVRAIDQLLELGDWLVRSAVIPRQQLAAVPLSAERREVFRVLSECGAAPVLVYGKNEDEIAGVLNLRKLIADTHRHMAGEQVTFEVARVLDHPPVVLETSGLEETLARMRGEGSSLALVVDEFGTVSGVLSVEALTREILGGFGIGGDEPASEPVTQPDLMEMDGATPVRAVESIYLIALPTDGGFDTLAGFLMFLMGKVPKPGDRVEYAGHGFTVLSMEGNRIAQVRIERLAGGPAPN